MFVIILCMGLMVLLDGLTLLFDPSLYRRGMHLVEQEIGVMRGHHTQLKTETSEISVESNTLCKRPEKQDERLRNRRHERCQH